MSDAIERLANFLQQNRAEILNVAGSRASKEPDYAYVTLELGPQKAAQRLASSGRLSASH
jgi:hypothetical protein